MRILAVDSSATAASAAVTDDDKILSEFYTNTGLTHSQTLMPMVESALKCASIELSSIDVFAVTNGPGSFTGVRIGVAAVKGIAMPFDKPCVGVSTLEAIAYNMLGIDCIVCAVMDARRNQVYNALFESSGNGIKRLTEDRAIDILKLENDIKNYKIPVFLVGDGAFLCYNKLVSVLPQIRLAPSNLRYQRASGAALAAKKKYDGGSFVESTELVPTYLRLPQAERELNNLRKRV